MQRINEGDESPILEAELDSISVSVIDDQDAIDADAIKNGDQVEVNRLCLEEKRSDAELKTLLTRSAAQRHEPWMKVLPARNVVLTMYRTVSSSIDMKPGNLIGLAKKLLDFVSKLEEQTSLTGRRDMYFKEYVGILDSLFTRITSSHLDNDHEREDLETFVESLWTTYKNGTIKFDGTSIPERLVNRCPSKLEHVMAGPEDPGLSESLEILQDNLSIDTILPLCLGSSKNFMKVIELLFTRFSTAPNFESKSKVVSFCHQLLSNLEDQTRNNFFQTFPIPFQPLIAFITTINQAGLAGPLINSLISDEIVVLLDYLYRECESSGINLSLVSFILLSLPQLPQASLRKCSSVKSIVFKKTPYLKKAMLNSDINFFQTNLLEQKRSKVITIHE